MTEEQAVIAARKFMSEHIVGHPDWVGAHITIVELAKLYLRAENWRLAFIFGLIVGSCTAFVTAFAVVSSTVAR